MIIINIEGTDGCGKRTQGEKLAEALKAKGYKVMLQSFPNYDSESSHPVKMYLRGDFGDSANCLDAYQASALFAVDRLCTMKNLEGRADILILDRYTNSNMMFQSTKIEDEKARKKYCDWLLDFEYNVLAIAKPDLVFFLDMPVEKSEELARSRSSYKTGDNKDIHEEDHEYLAHCYRVGTKIAKDYGWTVISCVDKKSELKSINEIHEEILKVVLKLVKKSKIAK